MVSRLLNQDSTLRIRPATRVRILNAVDELGYRPNASARALRMAKTGALGLVVHDITNPVFGAIISGAHQAASEAGYVLLLGEAAELERRSETLRLLLTSGRIDGLLLQRHGSDESSYGDEDAALAELTSQRLPTVLLNDWTAGAPSAVALDDFAAAHLATRHLIELGHEKIAHLAGAASHRANQRRRGYEQALQEAGLTTRPGWIAVGGWDQEHAWASTESLLAARPRPTAVVAANVLASLGAVSAIHAAGFRVPDDLSVIAIHEVWVARYTTPPLTTVQMPLSEMGRQAVKLLLAQLADAEPRVITISSPPPTIILRASTGPPPASNT